MILLCRLSCMMLIYTLVTLIQSVQLGSNNNIQGQSFFFRDQNSSHLQLSHQDLVLFCFLCSNTFQSHQPTYKHITSVHVPTTPPVAQDPYDNCHPSAPVICNLSMRFWYYLAYCVATPSGASVHEVNILHLFIYGLHGQSPQIQRSACENCHYLKSVCSSHM